MGGSVHSDAKKHTFLGNMFGKMHGSSRKKTPAKSEEETGHSRGTVRKLFPFSPSRIPKSANSAKSAGLQQSTKKSGAMRCVVREKDGELIPASRGKVGSEVSGGPRGDDSSIRVVIRIRPASQKDRRTGAIESSEGSVNLQSGMGERHSFSFDTVLDEKTSQTDVYWNAGASVIDNCLKGFHGCLLAYGQTGSGKTYSMMGVPERALVIKTRDDPDRGVIQRSFEDLFHKMEHQCVKKAREGGNMRYSVVCSFIEIYNESLTDLTCPDGGGLNIRDDPVKGVYVEGVEEHPVSSVADVEEILCMGMSNRKVAETLANDRSSRSHSVFTATIEQTIEEPGHGAPVILRSRLHLVDLAGSERQKSSGAAGHRLKEASNINKSLSALGHVIMSLVDLQQGKQRHIPYRDSKLTYLLQDALGGTSKTVLLATISPAMANASETLSTLRFADNVKRIRNKAVVNQSVEGDVDSLRKEVLYLRQELSKAMDRASSKQELSLKEEGPMGEDGSRKALVAALRREEDVSRKVASIQEELDMMQELVDAKEADLQRTKMMLRLKESRITRSQATHDESHKVAALEQEISLLKQKIESHPEVKRFALENIRLRRHIEDHVRGDDDQVGTASMVTEEEFQQLRKELLALSSVAEKAMEEAKTLRAETSAAKEVLRTAEKKKHMSPSPNTHSGDGDDHGERIAELEKQLDNLQMLADKHSSQQSEYERLCSHAAELDAVVETLTIRCGRLQRERDDWRDSYPLVLETLVEGWDQNASLINQVNKLQESLTREKETYTRQHEKAKERVEEALKTASLLNKELQLKDSRVADLQEYINGIESEKESLRDRMVAAESDVERISREYEEHRETLSRTETALEASRKEVEEQIRISEEATTKLQELQTLNDSMNEASMSREKEVHSLQAALAAADIDAQMARAQLKEKARELSQLDESETSLRRKVIELQKKMEDSHETTSSAIRELTLDLEASQRRVQTLESELESNQRAQEKLQEQSNHGWAEERKYLLRQVKDLQEKLDDAEARAQNNLDTVQDTGPLGKEARARSLSQKLQDAEDTILHLTQEVATLKTQVKSRDETLATVRNQMAMEVTDAAQQVQELVAAQARAEDLERQLAHIRRQHGLHA